MKLGLKKKVLLFFVEGNFGCLFIEFSTPDGEMEKEGENHGNFFGR